MDDKSYAGPVPPYTVNPTHPPPGPADVVSPMNTGVPTGPPQHHDPYNQGPPPAHPPPGTTSPTQYPHQPIAPPTQQPQQPHNYDHTPVGSPPPMTHQTSYPMAGQPTPQQQQQQHPIGQASPPLISPGQEKHEYYATPGVAPGQQGIPMQNHPGMPPAQPSGQFGTPTAQVYHTVTPLASLNEGPAPVDCPVCHTRAMTRCERHSGNTTHAWAAVICFCCGLGCIPYLINGLKDSEHYCGHCGVMLATYKNSGHTVVHQHG